MVDGAIHYPGHGVHQMLVVLHGGEPVSVKFCHKVGLNYVSCSPYRVPIARLAAAQAVLEEKVKK